MNEKVVQEARQITASFFAERRKELGITQEELAAMMQVNPSTIVRLEQGKYYIRFDTLMKLCHFLKLSPFYVPKESALFNQFQSTMKYKNFID